MTLRFVKGEIAILAISDNRMGIPIQKGDEVEIVRVGPFVSGDQVSGPCWPELRYGLPRTLLGDTADYEVRCAGGFHWFVDDPDLRKRRPPIPDEVLEVFNVEPVDKGVPA